MALRFPTVGDDRDDPCSDTPYSIRTTPCSSVLGSSLRPYWLSGAVMSKTIVLDIWPRQE